MKKLCHYISEYMGLLVLAAALLALVFPGTLGQIRPTVINYLLGVVMSGMGLTLDLQDFKIVFSRPKDVIIGCLAQFTIMPLLAWGLTQLFQLDEALALGVVLVGCCPGGTASNVITYLAKGDRLSSRFLLDSHCLHCCHHHRCQCRQVVGRGTHYRLGGHAPQCLRTEPWLSDRPVAWSLRAQEEGHLHRGGYAELRTGQ